MRKEAREILICMIEQGYKNEVADFYLGKINVNIYDGKIIEIEDVNVLEDEE